MQSIISRRNFLIAVPLVVGALATLGGCGEDSNAEVLDLTGTWVSMSDDGEINMTAVIEGDEITIYWGDSLDNVFSVFWAGSYEAPNKSTKSWSWKSKRDEDRFGIALAATDVDTIEFTYKNDVITFEASLYGLTQTAELQRLSSETGVTVIEEVEEAEADDDEYTWVYWTVNGIESSAGFPTDDSGGHNIYMLIYIVMESTNFIVNEGHALEYSEYQHSGYQPSNLETSTFDGIVTVTCTIDGIPVQFEVPTDIDYNELAALVVDVTLDALRQAGEY